MARKKNSIDSEVLKKIYRTVVRIRHFEEQGIKLYRQGLIKGYFHPYLGQEGIAAGVCAGPPLRQGRRHRGGRRVTRRVGSWVE